MLTIVVAWAGPVVCIALVAAARRASAAERLRATSTRVHWRIPSRVRPRLERALFDADIAREPETAVELWVIGVLGALMAGLAVAPGMAVPAALGAVLAGPAGLWFARARREQRFVVALPGALEQVASELRGGGTVAGAVGRLAEGDAVVSPDFRRIHTRTQIGLSLHDALSGWPTEHDAPGVRAAAGALAVAAALGGRAADAIDGLATSLRHRLDAAAEARALSSQARLSAVVVGAAPIGYLAFSSVVDQRVGRCARGHRCRPGVPRRRDRARSARGVVDPPDRPSRGMTVAWILGIAWGGMCASPFVTRGRRAGVGSRINLLRGELAPERAHGRARRFPGLDRLRSPGLPAWVRVPADSVLRVVHSFTARRCVSAEEAALARELPVVVDLLGVAVAAGCTPYLAVDVAVRWGPPRAANALSPVLRACALGTGFESALEAAAADSPALRGMVDALLASDRLGAPVGPQLARLADEERAALRRRAETHARRVPVKLLFPLVFLVLPAFVLLTVVPGLVAGLQRI